MLKSEVVIGERYKVRLGMDFAVVRIDAIGHRGGWAATNLNTGRAVHIKSAAKLRRVANDADVAYYSQLREDKKQWKAEHKAQYGY